jgi:hypothetical protein
VELYLNSPNTPSWRGAQKGGAQGQLLSMLIKRSALIQVTKHVL